MRSINISNTSISSLEIISQLDALEELVLDGVPVRDFSSLGKLKSLYWLDLDRTAISDLTPLTNLTKLKSLFLDDTKVADLSPLQNLKGLENLSIQRTEVSDLRPISSITGLISVGSPGLRFDETLAVATDSRLRELKDIVDHDDRARQTLAYLRTLPPWPEPYTPAATPDGSPPKPIGVVPKAPEQDRALPLIWGDNGFAFFAESIAADTAAEAALEDLRDLLDGLRRKGNAHDDLYRIAGELQERSAGAISDLNMVKLHLSYQKLRRLHKGRAGRDHKFDDETVSQMEAVLDILPGVTLADDNVRTLIARQEAERAAGLTAQEDVTSAKLLEDVQHPDAPFADEVKDVAAEVLKSGADDRLSGTRRILSSNVMIAVLAGLNTASALITVGDFAYKFGPHLLAYAATMGDDAFFWAQAVLSKFRVEYELAMGIAHETSAAPRVTRSKPKPKA